MMAGMSRDIGNATTKHALALHPNKRRLRSQNELRRANMHSPQNPQSRTALHGLGHLTDWAAPGLGTARTVEGHTTFLSFQSDLQT
jgi:hypothetical protein